MKCNCNPMLVFNSCPSQLDSHKHWLGLIKLPLDIVFEPISQNKQ